jgi:hypothetical protein
MGNYKTKPISQDSEAARQQVEHEVLNRRSQSRHFRFLQHAAIHSPSKASRSSRSEPHVVIGAVHPRCQPVEGAGRGIDLVLVAAPPRLAFVAEVIDPITCNKKQIAGLNLRGEGFCPYPFATGGSNCSAVPWGSPSDLRLRRWGWGWLRHPRSHFSPPPPPRAPHLLSGIGQGRL